jgi:hypothetical protein
LGAFRHNLLETWRYLIEADPDDPGTLARWRRLDEDIRRLDEQESEHAVRYGAIDDANKADDDDWDGWDGWGNEYGCPVHRCERKAKAFLSVAPRCDLFGTEMTPLPLRHRGHNAKAWAPLGH